MSGEYSFSSIIYNIKYDQTILRLYNLILERDDDELEIYENSSIEFRIVLGDDSIVINILDYVDKEYW